MTVLSGDIEVSPFMLAAYSGIATRNSGFNDPFEKDNARIAINSLAAAYVITRELVRGTVAYEEVRAVVGLSYFCFMILPLLFILPLMCVITRGSPPPVPLSTWDSLVLARDEETVIPHRDESDLTFPPKPKELKFGIAEDETTGSNHLGLEVYFVPLTENIADSLRAPRGSSILESARNAFGASFMGSFHHNGKSKPKQDMDVPPSCAIHV